MKTIQCTHPPHHDNGFVATCRLWMASGGGHALLVLEPTEYSTSTPCLVLVEYIYIYNHENNVLSRLSPQWFCGNSCTWGHCFHDYIYITLILLL